MMYFDDITRDGRLWSVRYEGESENALFHCFAQWNDVEWLREFFIENRNDLERIFRPLDNRQTVALMLDKEKARLKNRPAHVSWLRLYAIRLEEGSFIITGGAIKLTETMPERTHTFQELAKMEKVRNFLLDENIVDRDSFEDYQNAL